MKNFHLLIICYLLFSSILLADIINVPVDASTIQAGIDIAVNGDTVLVADGLYYENINFKGKAITVASNFILDDDTSHISATIIDGSNPSNPDSGSVVSLFSGEDTTSVLCGFTITGGTGTKFLVTIPVPPYDLVVRAGAGITMFNSGATIFHNRIVQNNLDDSQVHECVGGGISSGPPGNSSWTIIESNLIKQNSCTNGTLTNSGGGLGISSNARVCGNTIRDNQASSNTQQAVSGGLHFEGCDSIIVIDNTVVGNQAITNSTSQLGVGGGMYFMRKDSACIKVLRNILAFNQVKSSSWSGANGVGFDNINGDVLFANNIIYDNYYNGNQVCHGGGIYVSNSKIKVINNTFNGNEAAYGGGVCNRFSEETVYINNIFWNNNAYIDQNEIQIIKNSGDENPIFNYCDIQGGWEGKGNIDVKPMFIDSLFHLSDSSRCIGKGIMSYNFSGNVVNTPEYDAEENIRPDPAGSRPDLGAVENERAYPLLTVIQIPEDYEIIQDGVYAAEDGDTILVAEGTYYENIIIQSKAITLASYFLMDEDTSHISKTIINGSQPVNADNASLIMILDTPEPNTICGFTLTGGLGRKKIFPDETFSQIGGGIDIEESSAIIKNNHIINNAIISSAQARGTLGGGISWGAGVSSGLTLKISGNLISGNEISGMMTGGGGINISNYVIGGELDYLIEENIIENNTIINTDEWKAMGGGIFLDFCLPTIGNQTIRNNIIQNNKLNCLHSFGGGLYFIIRDTEASGTVDDDPGPYIYNNIISGNHSDYFGGGVSVWRAYYVPPNSATPLKSAGNYVPKPSFINNTIVNNTALDGSGFFIYNHVPLLMNNILWNDYPQEAVWGEIFLGNEPYFIDPTNKYGNAEIYYSDIQGGWDKGLGNIDSTPHFSDTLNFYLSEVSACIDAGHDASIFNDIEIGGVVVWPAMGSARNDMGAYGGPYNYNYAELAAIIKITDIPITHSEVPKIYNLSQNYPNPFNPSTIINYGLPIMNYVELSIYNLLGQKILTLVSEKQGAGYHQVQWDATGLASGVYYYRLEAGNFVQTRKIIYLK